jgi:hypothetical protein
MTLRPTDMLQIQSAIDEYEKKFPRRPPPTAEEALAWRFGTREGVPPGGSEPEVRRIRLGWFIVRMPRLRPALADDTVPAVRKFVRLGWWGAFAVGTASVFLLGAFVGGFK